MKFKIIPTSNLEGYIILPGDLRSDKYHNLLVGVNRLSYSPEIKQLGLSLQNNNQGFIGNINHEQALGLNRILGEITLSPRYFNDFLYLIYQGIRDNRKVYDVKGKKVNIRLLNKIWNDITKVRTPWRAEWLNAKFSKVKEAPYITYDKVMDNGNVRQVGEKLDEDTLMENKTPGISLEDWLKNPTNQGLPRKNIQNGSLYYWYPIENAVAGFYADSGRAVLSCGRNPTNSNIGLGVRRAKILK
jgi:hypothetical protein